jgi:pyruvate kinase
LGLEPFKLAVNLLARRTKILCTLGPASSSLKTIRALMDAGMDAVRLNFSHGNHESHRNLIDTVRQVADEKGLTVPIIQDLQGPRFRVDRLSGDRLDLKRGMEVTVTSGKGPRGLIHVRPEFSFRDVKVGHHVLIGDGGIRLRVKSRGRERLRCKVTAGGTVFQGKGISFPDSKSSLPSLTAKDRRDLRFGKSARVTYIALSFVRKASDVAELRRSIGAHDIGIISKIETREALDEIDAIVDASDAVLVARGDLASEVSISRVPVAQKVIIEKCNRKARPVITATQMLESMISNPQPTRAEASDVANAVLDGSDTLMLSGETAAGAYPVAAVKMMASIIRQTEAAHLKSGIGASSPLTPEPEISETIAYVAASAADNLGASAIITFTMSGSTALRVAKFRPKVPIFAVTPSEATRLRLGISHGTICGTVGRIGGTDQMIKAAINAARVARVVNKGDVVVVTAGVPPLTRGKTNILKIETV